MKIYMKGKGVNPLDTTKTHLKHYILDFYMSKYITNSYVDFNKDVLKKGLPLKRKLLLYNKELTESTRTIYTTYNDCYENFSAYSTSLSKHLYKLYFVNKYAYALKHHV